MKVCRHLKLLCQQVILLILIIFVIVQNLCSQRNIVVEQKMSKWLTDNVEDILQHTADTLGRLLVAGAITSEARLRAALTVDTDTLVKIGMLGPDDRAVKAALVRLDAKGIPSLIIVMNTCL